MLAVSHRPLANYIGLRPSERNSPRGTDPAANERRPTRPRPRNVIKARVEAIRPWRFTKRAYCASPACPFLHSSRNFLRFFPCSPCASAFLEHSNDWADCACFPAPAAEGEGAAAVGAGDAGAGVCAKAAPANIAAANPNAITFPNVFIVLTFAISTALSLSSDRELTATNFASGLFERRRTIARMRRAWQGNLSQ